MEEHAFLEQLRTHFYSVFFPSASSRQRADLIRQDWQQRFDRLQNIVSEITHSGQAFSQPAVVIGGTSGKGSTALLLARVLAASGKRVGVFTSPHLVSLRERFCVLNNSVENEKNFWPFIEDRERQLSQRYPELSFFEALFVLAGYWFNACKCDVGVWEAGCGGRWDATNALVRKKLTLITNVQLDHQELLGDTREKIAAEKAPLISHSDMCVLGESDPSIRQILETERLKWNSTLLDSHAYELNMVLNKDGRVVPTQLYGEGQLQNLNLVAIAASALDISPEVFRKALMGVQLPGRIEVVQDRPRIVLDVAHNPHKIQDLLKVVSRWNVRRRLAVVSFSERKDVKSMMQLLGAAFDHIWVSEFQASQERHPKSISEIQQMVAEFGLTSKVSFVPSVQSAIQEAKSQLTEQDLLVITGSIFLYAEAATATGLSPNAHLLRCSGSAAPCGVLQRTPQSGRAGTP